MKPSLPQGTRDFAADTLRRRTFIIDTIKEVFELYGFEPLETPAMENLETLMGKYGDEGDKLIYRILDSGNPLTKDFFISFGQFLKDHHDLYKVAQKMTNDSNEKSDFEQPFWKISPAKLEELAKKLLEDKNLRKYLPAFKSEISSKALRYDLTIPFARYVAMNYGKLTVPFKRYQVQPVWRADRPQKGRYREFFQCDADIAGTYSLISDVELAEIYVEVFKRLNIEADVKINSRKILYALAEVCGSLDIMNKITATIDKLDKIGIEKVKEKLKKLSTIISTSETGKKGIEELKFILGYLNNSNTQTDKQTISIDFTLARGLNYYTGIIYEVKAKNISMGSIGGGGRYDDLTGLFGVPNVPGVGISFGLDRIYDVMDELALFPESINQSTKVLFFNLGEKESRHAFKLMQELRRNGISCELFYENAKLDKQFKYASKKNIPFAAIIGSNEMELETCVLKNLEKGEQQTIPVKQLSSFLKK